jgi:hypothetical protein
MILDTRCLLVTFLKDEFVTWRNLIYTIIKRGTTTAKETESIIRQLGYLGMAIPFVHHFLSRLGNLHTRAKIRRSIPINDKCCKDLELMLHIIKIAHDGINMNIIVIAKVPNEDVRDATDGSLLPLLRDWPKYLPSLVSVPFNFLKDSLSAPLPISGQLLVICWSVST